MDTAHKARSVIEMPFRQPEMRDSDLLALAGNCDPDRRRERSLRLGRLERHDLRAAWANEASDFTPWLARPENIALLGDALGPRLEVEAQEKAVGQFRADILCRDIDTERRVLIENQLERTNHVHLGQILTYAAGLEAFTIVWLAARFTEEHRAVLDWLNRGTHDGLHFFWVGS